jgi:hypothetical protein
MGQLSLRRLSQPPNVRRVLATMHSVWQRITCALRRWNCCMCAEGLGFDSCPPHRAFLWGNGIVIVRLAEWPVPVWGLSEG